MVQALYRRCLDVADWPTLKWCLRCASFFPYWSIARYDWSDLVNNIVFVIGELSCRAKPADGPGNEVSCVSAMPAVKASSLPGRLVLRRSQKSVCYGQAVVYEEVGSTHDIITVNVVEVLIPTLFPRRASQAKFVSTRTALTFLPCDWTHQRRGGYVFLGWPKPYKFP